MDTKNTKIPKAMQALFWSSKIDDLSIKKDKNIIIQRILANGSISDLRWLKKNYSLKTIKTVFISKPQNIYTPSALNFVSKYIIKYKGRLPIKKYVKNVY